MSRTTPPTPKEAADVLRDFADRVESGEIRIMAVSASYEHAPVEYSSLTINFVRKHVQHQASDTMYCSCGKSWDMNDPYPPESCQ